MQTQYKHYTADNIRDKIIIVNSQMFLNYLHFSLLCYIILNSECCTFALLFFLSPYLGNTATLPLAG